MREAQGAGLRQARPPAPGHGRCSAGLSGAAGLLCGQEGEPAVAPPPPWGWPGWGWGFWVKGSFLRSCPGHPRAAEAGVLGVFSGHSPHCPFRNSPQQLSRVPRPTLPPRCRPSEMSDACAPEAGVGPGLAVRAPSPGGVDCGTTGRSRPSHGAFMEEPSGQAPGRPLMSPVIFGGNQASRAPPCRSLAAPPGFPQS